MARPQFRRLDYDLFERLEMCKLPGCSFQVLLVVIDYTIGYQKQKAAISLTTFQNKTWLSRQSVIAAIKDLEQRHIIQVDRRRTDPREATMYAVNHNGSEWERMKRYIPSTVDLTRGSQADLTRGVVKATILDQSSVLDQTSQVVTSATPTESNLKETIKKELTNINSETIRFFKPPKSPIFGGLNPTTEPSLQDTTRKKKKLLEHLRQSSKPCPVRQLSQELNVPYGTVQCYLSEFKKAGLVTNTERGRWIACSGVAV
ncbi:replication protein [Candidatus Magnetobacterium casense]|uniref:Replication protein n=1 Tax=Candidatus Magnetobacterium casense TaxID=1455061 RepID=A0ABS6S2W2_9BACT|nr:replication protein [Candidatus Magnetobacterium casensis]MBV6343175.1 replication protein [Candidatus Magnetobacterium casensis]